MAYESTGSIPDVIHVRVGGQALFGSNPQTLPVVYLMDYLEI